MTILATIDAALVTTIGVVGTALIGAVVTGIIKIIGAIAALRNSNEASAVEAKQSAKTQLELSEKTHNLVNGGLTPLLRSNEAVTAKLADLTGKPSDIAAAKVASENLVNHQANQNPSTPTAS